MTAEDIADPLGMARSNVSNSIKELLAWGLIRRVPILGDRRDHFEAETDIWEMAARIAAGRKEREIDPAVDALRACVADAADDPTHQPGREQAAEGDAGVHRTVDRWYSQMLTVPRPQLIALIKLGEKIVSFLPGKMQVGGESSRGAYAMALAMTGSPRSPRHPAAFHPETRSTTTAFARCCPPRSGGALPVATWRRFSKRLAAGSTIVYVGEVEEADSAGSAGGSRK